MDSTAGFHRLLAALPFILHFDHVFSRDQGLEPHSKFIFVLLPLGHVSRRGQSRCLLQNEQKVNT